MDVEIDGTSGQIAYLKKIPWQEAREVEQWVSIRSDLIFSSNCCRVALDHFEKVDGNEDEQVIVRGLWHSAVVSYTRCFAGGKRVKLTLENAKSVAKNDKESSEIEKVHQFFLDLRNKHIAHRVNGFEDCVMGVIENDARDAASVEVNNLYYTSPEIDGIKLLAVLTERLVDHVTDRMRPSWDECSRKAASFSIEDIRHLPPATMSIAQSKDAGVPRQRQ